VGCRAAFEAGEECLALWTDHQFGCELHVGALWLCGQGLDQQAAIEQYIVARIRHAHAMLGLVEFERDVLDEQAMLLGGIFGVHGSAPLL
jgi:hypothetical protein